MIRLGELRLLKSKIIDEVVPFALVIVCVASARFIQSELASLLVFIATLVIYI